MDGRGTVELDGDPLPVTHGGPARLVPANADSECWESVWVSAMTARGTSSEILQG